MFFYEGLSCPHCHRTFRESDDIVACPVCGAPHHRGCWGDAGGCACAADHGTDKQWSRNKAAPHSDPDAQGDKRPCPHCGGDNSPYAEFCAFCGRELSAREWHSAANTQNDVPPVGNFGNTSPYQGSYTEYAPFHVQSPFGGVSPDTVIEGESARDVAAVVRINTTYYMPRFERMSKSGSKVSWNWAAFFIPSYWLLHRKQHLAGALMLILDVVYMVIQQLIYYGYFVPAFQAAFPKASSITAVDPDILANWMLDTPSLMWAFGLLGMLCLTRILIQVCFGMFANRLYLRACANKIRKTRDSYPEGYQAQLTMLGGTSIALALIGYMCMTLIPTIIISLIL